MAQVQVAFDSQTSQAWLKREAQAAAAERHLI